MSPIEDGGAAARNSINVLYAFPESLPLPRARGFQAVRSAISMSQAGLRVVLMHSPGDGDAMNEYGYEKPATLSLIPVSRSLPWPLGRFGSNGVFFRRVIREMQSISRPDAIFTRHLKIAVRFLKSVPIPLVYEAHEVFSDTAPAKKRRTRFEEEQLVFSRASAIVANSEATAGRLRELYGTPRKLIVLPNGVDRPERYPEKAWFDLKQRIVYAGSLFGWKGVDDLVAAGRWLKDYRIEIIGGEPSDIERLRARVPAGGAQYLFSGRLLHAEVMKRLASSCVAVLPNRADPESRFTSPIKLFEYLASGCAIVASNIPSIREILEDTQAQWSIPGDPENIAKAIRVLASDPERAAAMGERAYALSGSYTWDARGRRLMELIASVLQNDESTVS